MSVLSLHGVADEVFYFGDSHSTGTMLARKLKDFLTNPQANGCATAPSGTHQVYKYNGNGLDPRHWLSTGSNSKNFLYRTLEQRNSVERAGANETALTKLLSSHAANSNRKLVLEFGDNSVAGNNHLSFESNIEKMVAQIGVTPENCIVVAPQPHIKPELREGKQKVLAALKRIQERNICQVVFYDETTGGRLPLTDGIHSTASGYTRWANQAIAGICASKVFAPQLVTPSDSIQGCDDCPLEGLPEIDLDAIDRQLHDYTQGAQSY